MEITTYPGPVLGTSPVGVHGPTSAEKVIEMQDALTDPVIDIEPTAGRFRSLSRLPQYFTKAIFGWALAVTCIAARDGERTQIIDIVSRRRGLSRVPARRHEGAGRQIVYAIAPIFLEAQRWRRPSKTELTTTASVSQKNSTSRCLPRRNARNACTTRCATPYSTAARESGLCSFMRAANVSACRSSSSIRARRLRRKSRFRSRGRS